MARRIPKRRRREYKTDYKLRLGLLKSGKTRIVIRRTNNYFIVQAVSSVKAQDSVKLSVTSKDLLSYGWKKEYSGSLKSIPAGYLTGLLFSHTLLMKEEKNLFIVDLGMMRTLKGSRVFAVVKGLIDGGLELSVGKDCFPSNSRLIGEHLKPELKDVILSVKEALNGKRKK